MNHVFLSGQNIRLLWDLLIEEPTINNLPQNKQELVYNNFIQNINLFYKNESEHEVGDSLNLVTLNKKFLKIMLDLIRKEPVKKYKIEDIQTDRQQMFEMQLNKRKNDFEQSINLKKPPVPNFADNIENDKIQNIEELINQARMQRNFDVPDIPKEREQQNTVKERQSGIKYIQIQEPVANTFNKEIIDLPTADLNDINFLHKLKTIKEPSDVNITNKLEELEQKINTLHDMIEKVYNKISAEST